jgi:hypothetical protein
VSYWYLGGLVINRRGYKRGRITGPLMAEQEKDTLGNGGLWDSGTLGRGAETEGPVVNRKGGKDGI